MMAHAGWEVGRSQLPLVPGVFKGVVVNFLDEFVMLSRSLCSSQTQSLKFPFQFNPG
jgi:hypothetical protein